MLFILCILYGYFSDLPLETWTDVFGFLPRSQLVAFSPHIHDRQFARVVQFFLHKCGQITLGNLHITTSQNGNEPIIAQNGRSYPLADVPIPSNVVNFKEIRLRFAYIFAKKILTLLHFWPPLSKIGDLSHTFVKISVI
jgi:hypothetical protein